VSGSLFQECQFYFDFINMRTVMHGDEFMAAVALLNC